MGSAELSAQLSRCCKVRAAATNGRHADLGVLTAPPAMRELTSFYLVVRLASKMVFLRYHTRKVSHRTPASSPHRGRTRYDPAAGPVAHRGRAHG